MPQCHMLPVLGQQTVGSMSVTGNPCHPTQACPPSLTQRPLHLWVHCASTGVTEESLADIQKKNDLVHLALGIVLYVGCSLVGINVYICYAFIPLNPAMYHFPRLHLQLSNFAPFGSHTTSLATCHCHSLCCRLLLPSKSVVKCSAQKLACWENFPSMAIFYDHS